MLTILATGFSLTLGCATSPPPIASEPLVESEPIREEPLPEPTSNEPDTTLVEMPPPPRANGAREDAVDYEITNRDCDTLGQALARVTRADQLAALDPNVSAARKAEAERGITEVSGKVGERWAAGCRESLAGGVTQESFLQCALRAKTVSAFDECLNGPTSPKK